MQAKQQANKQQAAHVKQATMPAKQTKQQATWHTSNKQSKRQISKTSGKQAKRQASNKQAASGKRQSNKQANNETITNTTLN